MNRHQDKPDRELVRNSIREAVLRYFIDITRYNQEGDNIDPPKFEPLYHYLLRLADDMRNFGYNYSLFLVDDFFGIDGRDKRMFDVLMVNMSTFEHEKYEVYFQFLEGNTTITKDNYMIPLEAFHVASTSTKTDVGRVNLEQEFNMFIINFLIPEGANS